MIKELLKNLTFKLSVPTFICYCGEEILDTPENRVSSYHIEHYSTDNHSIEGVETKSIFTKI